MPLDPETVLSRLAGQVQTREAADAWLAQLGAQLGLANLALDADDTAALSVDGLDIVLSWLEGSMVLTATIDIGPAKHLAPEQLLAMLQGNGDWRMTAGGTLGIDPRGERILFGRAVIPVDTMLERAEADLAQLVDMARSWRVAIAAYIGEHQPGQDAVSLPPGMMRV